MKKYIFITNSIGGYSGGVCYVRNKLRWLQKNAWEVIVFDSTGQYFEPIKFEEFKHFSSNRLTELYFHPSWIPQNRLNRTVNKIIETINPSPKDFIVIESNLCILSEWAEIIATRIGAKHIFYLISENGNIDRYDSYLYHKYKVARNEFFAINSQRFISLFKNFQSFSLEEASSYVLKANNASEIIQMNLPNIEVLRKSDYTIGHFGRFKDYVPYAISQICTFANNHKNKTVSLLFLGIDSLDKVYMNMIKQANIDVILIPSTNPVPKCFFDLTDIVIATAGCASMAYRNGNYVISMDVENNHPLGIMGITTTSSSFKSDNDIIQPDLNIILNDFFDNKYSQDDLRTSPNYIIDYSQHMKFAVKSDGKYYDTHSLGHPQTFKEFIDYLFLKFGLARVRTIIRNFVLTKKIIIKPFYENII